MSSVAARPPTLVFDDLRWTGGTVLALLQRAAGDRGRPGPRARDLPRLPRRPREEEINATVVDVGSLATPGTWNSSCSRRGSTDRRRRCRRPGRWRPVPRAVRRRRRFGGRRCRRRSRPGTCASTSGSSRSSASPRSPGGASTCPARARQRHRGDDVGEAIDAAVDAGLLRADEHGGLVFVHDLVRETAARSVPAHRRLGLHAVIATSLDERGDVIGAAPHVLDGFAVLEPPRAVERSSRRVFASSSSVPPRTRSTSHNASSACSSTTRGPVRRSSLVRTSRSDR